MSGGMLDGLEGAAPPGDGEDYIAGQAPHADVSVLEQLLDHYSAQKNPHWIGANGDVLESFIPQRNGSSLDPDACIKEFIIGALYFRGESAGGTQSLYNNQGLYTRFVSPLLEAFHGLGYNNFHLDLDWFSGALEYVACDLNLGYKGFRGGKEANPLDLTVDGDVISLFGLDVRHCILTLNGDTPSAGCKAKRSIFTLNGEVGEAGAHAERSIFFIRSTRSLPDIGMPTYCAFYISDEIRREDVKRFGEAKKHELSIGRAFGNTLYRKNLFGSWQEVRI